MPERQTGSRGAEAAGSVADPIAERARKADERVANCKEHLMRMVEHLRREADYDYPPRTVRDRIRDVQEAERSYREAWDFRSRLER